MLDSGCFRTLSGWGIHEAMIAFLALYGLKPIMRPCQEEFVFGNGDTETSDVCFLYPVFFKGVHCDYLDIARIKSECPALIAKGKCRDWDIDMKFGSQMTKVNKFGHSFPFTKTRSFWISSIWVP